MIGRWDGTALTPVFYRINNIIKTHGRPPLHIINRVRQMRTTGEVRGSKGCDSETGSKVSAGSRAGVRTALQLLALAGVPATYAADEPPATDTLEAVIVTGTRITGLKADDSPAPVQVLDSGALTRTGQPDLLQAMTQNVPAFTVQGNGGDTQNLTVAAALRGLNPNNTLVLINGKRRHTTANLSVDSGAGPYQGGASADLSFIPTAAIDHVEVLTDGAAALYGTDAIAGVVNIILKSNATGGALGISTGQYYAGDGLTPDAWINYGAAPTPTSYVNVTAETKYHGYTDRGGIDPRAIDPGTLASNPTMVDYPGYPRVNRVDGDALYHLDILSLNAGVDLSDRMSLYGFGTVGRKIANSFENYRLPSVLPAVYPNGFEPQEGLDETDYAATLGLKGESAGWHWDLASTFGKDAISLSTIHSGNVSLFQDTGSTPTSAHDGNFLTSQWTTTADLTRGFDVGLANPLSVALGAEYRRETYEIDKGDFAATYLEGMQSFPGFTATDAGQHARSNEAGYVDFVLKPVDALIVDVAGRFEHYSDFGHASVGKLTTRYNFTPDFAIRGTISNGFRAPTLAEEYYSATNVNINSAFVQLPPNSAGARFVGVDGLKPEESTNYSLGFVTHIEKLSVTLDAYQIAIRDRIAASGAVFASGYGGTSPAVESAILANGNVLDPTVTNFGIQIFANGLDTRTRGAELVMSYPANLGAYGHIEWSLAGNYNDTVITNIHPTPVQLGGQTLYGPGALSDISTASPKYRGILTAHYTLKRFAATLRESLYGPSSEQEQGDDGNFYKTTIKAAPVTDINLDYQVLPSVTLSLGANNLLDRRPSSYNPALVANYRANLDPQSVLIPPGFSPFGINGGYYYGKITVTF